jgi:Ca-activated chloride channel family protein
MIFLPIVLALLFKNFKAEESKNFAALGSERTLRALTNISLRRTKLKQLVLLWAVFFIVLALLRPQWGLKSEKIEQRGLDLVIALDNSASMYAEDIQPSRLGKAVLEINKFLSVTRGDRIGLITFSGSATPVCPLTTDHAALDLFLKAITLSRDALPGTNIESAFNAALNMFDLKTAQDRIFLLITDGENHEGDLGRVKSEAESKGIVVVPVAIGTPGGQPVPLLNANGERNGYKKDKKGNIVISHLDIEALKKIATIGPYLIETNESSIIGLPADLKHYKRTKLRDSRVSLYTERYQIFLLLGLIFLVISYLLNDHEDKIYGKIKNEKK